MDSLRNGLRDHRQRAIIDLDLDESLVGTVGASEVKIEDQHNQRGFNHPDFFSQQHDDDAHCGDFTVIEMNDINNRIKNGVCLTQRTTTTTSRDARARQNGGTEVGRKF